MDIKEIEKQCIKLMQENNKNARLLKALDKSKDNVFEGKTYTKKQYDNIYKKYIDYNNNLLGILSEEERKEKGKIAIVIYFYALTEFLETTLARAYYTELQKYECNLLKSITMTRNIVDEEKEIFINEVDNILLERIKSNNTADIIKSNTIYTTDIIKEAEKRIQQKEYESDTFKNKSNNTSTFVDYVLCNSNIQKTLINVECIKVIARYFEEKYNLNLTYNFPLLDGSPLVNTQEYYIKELKETTKTIPDIEHNILYNLIKETYKNEVIAEQDQKQIKEMIEKDYKEYTFNGMKYIEELQELAHNTNITPKETKGV